MIMPCVEANGARIPAVGLGTWDLRGRTCARVVEQALRLGYRHIDTAEMYGNEREIGEGLRASGVKREDVFITTKVWQDHLAPREFEQATKESLARLRLSPGELCHVAKQRPHRRHQLVALRRFRTVRGQHDQHDHLARHGHAQRWRGPR